MGDSAKQKRETWLNEAFCVPSVPLNRGAHYPFSRRCAFVYRFKLAVVLLNAAAALWRMEEPCQLFSLLLNSWLLFVTCEAVYRNYPWREPLTIWMWKLYCAIPCSLVLLPLCGALALLWLGAGCKLSHPLSAVAVGWLCCMVAWPLVRENWQRGPRKETDYDQFSHLRSYAFTLPGPFRVILAALRSPSVLAFLVASATSLVVGLFFPEGWLANAWSLVSYVFLAASLAAICSHRLPEDVGRTLAAWEKEDDTYSLEIDNCLRMVLENLRKSGPPLEGNHHFDGMAIQVPLLLREAEILLKSGRTLTENQIRELKYLSTARETVEFRRRLDDYGPYTTQCCVS